MIFRKHHFKFTLLIIIMSVLKPIESGAADWTHWRGPSRNDVIPEISGWEDENWLATRPIWKANLGVGGTSPLVVDGRLYTMGWKRGKDFVYCLNAETGKKVWTVSYPCPKHGRYSTGDKGLYEGPSSTPEYDTQTNFLYTLSVDGDLNCWDVGNRGQKVWGINLYDTYGVEQRPKATRIGRRDYGYTTAPLVYNDWLLVEIGDDEGNLMAFDKRTGQRQWASENTDAAGHCGGPVPITVEGVPCIVVLTLEHMRVVRLDEGNEGKTVATFDWATDYANSIATPTVHENHVLLTAGYNQDRICKLEITLNGAKKVWEQPYVSKICSPVIYDGHIYWTWRKLRCLDFETGALKWEGGNFGDAGSCIVTADGRLIVWAHRGTLALVETAKHSPDAYRELMQQKGVFKTDVWPHVVFCDGKIYCKDAEGHLKCFGLQN